MSTIRVASYARISLDPQDQREGVERQRNDCLKVIEMRGWEVAEEYVDNDLSAYKRGVVRPAFEQMLTDLAEGRIDGIVAYDLDRFVRQPRDLERAIDIYEDRKGLVFATVQGDINLQSADGRTMARVMVAFANKSSADTGRRVARKHLETALSGRAVGGFRPFGWKADRSTLNHIEAQAVREAVELILTGTPLRSVVRGWNEDGLKTTAGREWQPSTLRQYLKNPRLIGLRTHQRKVLLDGAGEPVKGLWEPLLDVETWERLQTVLKRPEGRYRIPRRGARHYFLTGLIRCGQCSALMYGNRYAEGRHYYTCHDGKDHTVTISGVGADRLVGKLILARLASESLEATSSSQWQGEARLAEIGTQIDALMAAFLKSTISAEVAFPRVQALEEERAVMQNDRAQWLAESVGPAVQKLSQGQWEELDTDEQRAHAERWLEAVLVKPATQQQRGNRMSAERLVPVWRGLSGERHLAAVPS